MPSLRRDGFAPVGDDYCSNLVVWALPMALAKQSVQQFASADLVRDMIATLQTN
jgi:hypothetical protein